MNAYTIHAEDDEEGTELDLNSEVINTNNSDSLTDKNNIPLFTGRYHELTTMKYESGELFDENFTGVRVSQEVIIFQNEVIIANRGSNREDNQGSVLLIGGLLVVTLTLVTAIGTKYYLDSKAKKRRKSNANYF